MGTASPGRVKAAQSGEEISQKVVPPMASSPPQHRATLARPLSRAPAAPSPLSSHHWLKLLREHTEVLSLKRALRMAAASAWLQRWVLRASAAACSPRGACQGRPAGAAAAVRAPLTAPQACSARAA